jgi:hypothetical protein
MTNASVRILRDALRLSNSWDWWKIALHSLLRAQAANETLASAALAHALLAGSRRKPANV